MLPHRRSSTRIFTITPRTAFFQAFFRAIDDVVDITQYGNTSRAIFWILAFQQVVQFGRPIQIMVSNCPTKNPDAKTVLRDAANEISSEPVGNPANFHNVKGIIFDLDGTLVDSWKLGFDATAIILNKHGIEPITEEIYHDCTKYSTPERLARHARLEPSSADFQTVGQALAREFDELYVGLISTQTAGFFPGIGNLLQQLQSKDVVLGALTNACVNYAHEVLKVNSEVASTVTFESTNNHNDIYASFQSIRGADNVPSPKPAPDGLWQVCRDLNLPPDCCVYVGDSPSDAVAATAAGMPSIGVLWGSHPEASLRKAPFSRLCQTVDELHRLLIDCEKQS